MMSNDRKNFKAPKHGGPMGRGPMGGMVGGEKAKNFKGSFKKLLLYIGKYKFALLAVVVFAAVSTVFSVMGPKVMGRATTELAEGLMRKIQGTGGIDFDRIAQILLADPRLISGKRSLCLYSGLDNDRYYAENLLPHAQRNF